jgi:hypothetical protein
MTQPMYLHLQLVGRLAANMYHHQCVVALLALVNLWDAQVALAKTSPHFVSPISLKTRKNPIFVNFLVRSDV